MIGVPEEEKKESEAKKVLKRYNGQKFLQFGKRRTTELRRRINPKQNKHKEIFTKHIKVSLLEKIKILKSLYQ